MSKADVQYNKLINEIIENGTLDNDEEVRPVYADGTPSYTRSIISKQMRFDNSEIPVITTKKVGWKTAIKEMFWIWQMKSNVVQDLRDMGVQIWNEWELEDGTIGKAYGYQLAKMNKIIPYSDASYEMVQNGEIKRPVWSEEKGQFLTNQVDYLIYQLKHNRSSRRLITNLWNPDELDEMALPPCVYETQWYVKRGKLTLEVKARSNDMALGNPFNVFQYNVLQRMIAQVTGYELGEFIFNIGDCHCYDRHLETIKEQIKREQYEAPTLWINPEVKSFYDFTIDDFKLENYKHGDKLHFEVAI